MVSALRDAAGRLRPPPGPDSGVVPSGDPPPLVICDLGGDPPLRPAELRRRLPEGARLVALLDDHSSGRLIDALAEGCEDYLYLPLRFAELRRLWRRHLSDDPPASFLVVEEGRGTARLEFPSGVGYGRAAVERMLESCRKLMPLNDDQVFQLRVALGEAVTNAIMHGNEAETQRRVSVRAVRVGDELRIGVSDEGPGFRPDGVPDPTREENVARTRGRGLFLMRRLADRIEFREQGSEVTLVFQAPPGKNAGDQVTAAFSPDRPSATAELGKELTRLLDGYARLSSLRFRLVLVEEGGTVVLHDRLPAGPTKLRHREITVASGCRLEMSYAVPGGPEEASSESSEVELVAGFLAEWVGRHVRYGREVRLFSREMVDRYEEITLLTSISETLGSHIHVQEAAESILRELADVLGSGRASLWLHEEGAAEGLRPFASHVSASEQRPGLDFEQELLLVRRVFAAQEPVLLGGPEVQVSDVSGKDLSDTAAVFGEGVVAKRPVLSVPVSYAPTEASPRHLGVLNLIGRTGGSPFRAGDLRLMTAVASQIGAAIQNGRLVEESLRRERVLAELDIAHDLQLKMLPNLERFQDLADVAARCEPADSIGGDFYLLIRLADGRLGVMLGDVSSHGISAALIMALTMSAASIYARERELPGQVLLQIHRQLLRQLESTEMYMTLFYGVLEPGKRRLRYANAGHPFAYRLRPRGAERLHALDPPVGMTRRDRYHEADVAWRRGKDHLLLFTDGLVEGEGAAEEVTLLASAREVASSGSRAVVETLFAAVSTEGTDDRTALAVRI